MKIFLAGAKNLKHLDLPVQTKIMSICRANHDILVGDCYGVDSAVLSYWQEMEERYEAEKGTAD